ncbi:uncharacterized protein LOC123665328 [Melitaea cinxia]|uniref:uncharacterized protein LOC123665328 n=1 Tax=Melitaea cinxia TaxID=113334 RepID=UPI001E271510|nr:uncharacterized protein LOC123665328 [Melitaea cinxia]
MDIKKVVKFQHEVFDNLNIASNFYTQSAVFWNKYQIFFYEDLDYETLRKKSQWIYVSEFIIVQLILSSNHIICLDSCGDLYISPLKFKLKNVTSNFQKREKEIVGLASGTLIKITLSREHNIPDIIHLNKAIAKFTTFNETIIYSDGISLWKADQTFSETYKTFREFIVKHVKDFIKVDDKIVCVTYSKMIYFLPLEDELSYVQIPTVTDYCPSKHMYNHVECLYQVIDEISKNDSLAQAVAKQEKYITALALSNRTDLVEGMIQCKIKVYDKYEDILKEAIPLLVTSNIGEYFDTHTFYFLIEVATSTTLEQKYIDVLSNLFGNLQIHVTLLSEQKVLKTTSVKINEYLRELNILVPLNAQMLNLTYVNVNINLVTPVPGALNESETLWANLHNQTIILNSEQFIECDYPSNDIEYTKKTKKSIKELIFETTRNHHGQLFKINEVPEVKPITWYFLVKLPRHFEDSFTSGSYCFEIFSETKANYLLSEISSDEFLRSKNVLCWSVGNERSQEKLFKKCTKDNPSIVDFVNIFHRYQKTVMGAIAI